MNIKNLYLGFYLLLSMISVLTLTGCGEKASAGPELPPGLFIDSSTNRFLKTSFSETKVCIELEMGQFEGEFEKISVVLMPPVFPCKHYTGGCSGEYVEPNSLKVGSLHVWRHEVIHYLLYLNTGDPDASHQSPLFNTCV